MYASQFLCGLLQRAQDQRAHEHEKTGPASTEPPPSVDDDKDFLLEDYDSDSNPDSDKAKKRKPLKDLASENTDDGSDEEEEPEQPLKVFFCSRTHSQLSQFVKELQRTAFSTTLKTVSMGSRKSLCINPGIFSIQVFCLKCYVLFLNARQSSSMKFLKLKGHAVAAIFIRSAYDCKCWCSTASGIWEPLYIYRCLLECWFMD